MVTLVRNTHIAEYAYVQGGLKPGSIDSFSFMRNVLGDATPRATAIYAEMQQEALAKFTPVHNWQQKIEANKAAKAIVPGNTGETV